MKFLIPAIVLLGMACNAAKTPASSKNNEKPTISFTFDDGNINDMPGYKLEEWNTLLLGHLKKHHLKAILFSSGANKTGEKGKYILSSWNDAGHRIANHTFSHPNFGSAKTSVEMFEWELLSNDSIINAYSNNLKYFRFPYLKEGETKEKVEQFRQFMAAKGYKNGHVTIDASDWYVDSRLLKRLRENPKADIDGFRKFYTEHLLDRAKYYESLSYDMTGRHINHVILLHHNLAAALFLDDLIDAFEKNGWAVMDADKAYSDPIFNEQPTHIPAGESLIWALAKSSGKYESKLRYPAEDGDYEQEKMDLLGL